MDIRRFLTKPGGGSAAPPPKDKNEGKMVITPNKPKSPAKKGAPPAEKKTSQKGGGGSKDDGGPEAKKSRYFGEDGSGPSAAAPGKPPAQGPAKTETTEKGGASKRPRKKAIVESDDEDAESDEDVKMQDLKDSSSDDGDDVQMVDSSDDEDGGSKKTSTKKKHGAKKDAQPAKPASAAPASGSDKKKRDREMEVVDLGDEEGAEEAGPSKKKAAVGDKKPKAATPASASKPAAPRAPKAPGTSSSKKTKPTTTSTLSEDAQAAIAAVDAAVQKLPDESAVKFSFMPEGSSGPAQSEPPNLNNKEVPEGHPEALLGKTFVISGVLDSLFRETATDLIKKHSGKVTQSVSSKTTFLLVGNECGRSKYHDAKRHDTKLIDEDGLFSLIRATSHLIPKERPPSQPQPVAPSQALAPTPAGPSRAAAPKPATQVARTIPSVPAESQLWVDKHKPRTSKELVGNQGHLKTLHQWLQNWEAVQLHGAEAGTAGTQARPKDLGRKAVLMAGPPGTGKTSAAHIISRECGFNIVEMNASDTRNKADTKVSAGMNGKLANVIKEMCNNRSLNFGQQAQARKQVLIMDEVDGMSGGDRGGITDLIETIKKSKLPIICIANDKYNQKLKALKNYCLELDWYKPTEDAMARRCLGICSQEGLAVNESTLRELCRTCNGDVRLVLGQLQMLRLKARSLTYDQVKGRAGTSKDADMSPFECARRLMDPAFSPNPNKPGGMTTSGRLDFYFADADLVPLLVQENYLNHRPVIAHDEQQRMRAIAKAADCLSQGDVMNTTLRKSNNWNLMPAVGVLGTLMPAQYMTGSREPFNLWPGESNFPRFTAWMGNFSHGNKQKRLLGELTTTMASSGHVSLHRASVRLDYSSALRTLLTKPLQRDEEEGIPQTLSIMQDYCISKEQMEYVLDVTKFKTKKDWGEDPYKDVPTKVKSAFTRRFNQEGLVPKCNTMIEDTGIKKGKGAKGKVAVSKAKAKKKVVEEEEEEGEGEEGEEGKKRSQEEEDEEEEQDELSTDDPDVLEARLKQEGLQFQQASGKSSGRGSGRGRGGKGSSGGGRGSRGGANGGRGSGGGRGSSRGKK